MQHRFLLQILLLAQHVSGTTMPIIMSSRVLYSGCCLWYFVLWFSSCWSGVELRVYVSGLQDAAAVRSHSPNTAYSLFCQKLPNYSPCVTAFCIVIYRAGRRSGSFKLPCNLSITMPSVDSSSGIIRAVISRHFVVSPPFKSAHFCSFSMMALWRLWLPGTAACIKVAVLKV